MPLTRNGQHWIETWQKWLLNVENKLEGPKLFLTNFGYCYCKAILALCILWLDGLHNFIRKEEKKFEWIFKDKPYSTWGMTHHLCRGNQADSAHHIFPMTRFFAKNSVAFYRIRYARIRKKWNQTISSNHVFFRTRLQLILVHIALPSLSHGKL